MRRISIALVFLFGCGVGGALVQLAAPKTAVAGGRGWAYHCVNFSERSGNDTPAGRAEDLNAEGAKGWELVVFEGDDRACFKKPR